MPGIKNFTTEIPVEKTMGELIGHLARRGVTSISTLYDESGKPQGVGFTMKTEYGIRHFELPVRVDGVLKALIDDPQVPRPRKNREQAERTAWRIAKDWLEAQSALIDASLATLDEVMLPYMLNDAGTPLFGALRDGWMKAIES